jgi:hypothetical protein
LTKPYDYPSLQDLDLEIEDAAGIARGLRSHEELFVTYANGKYYLKTRVIGYETEWDFHFKISQRQAREIVKRGIADWWVTVDRGVR